MTVSYATLYLPGSSQGMQVVEGSQLHLIYVAMGANSIPSAPGQTVRQDPFPQYVDDDELAAALAGVGGAGGGAVDSVNGQAGAVVLDADDVGAAPTGHTHTKADIGLGNVDNTSDASKPISTAQQTALDAKANRTLTKNAISANYTLVAADATDKVLHTTSATAITITVPQDSAATIGQEIAIPWRQFAAGQITFAAGTGATLISRGSVFKSAGQNAEGLLTKVAANTWLLSGDITA